nr:metallophosphoesterase family protein [Bacteroidota bacterium]
MENSLSIRERWLARRFEVEKSRRKRQQHRAYVPKYWLFFDYLIHLFGQFLKLAGYYKSGLKNALDIKLIKVGLHFPHLPKAFDGYTILHMTDLHLDIHDQYEDLIIEKIKDLSVDLCVLTGDYRRDTSGAYAQVMEPLKKIVQSIQSKDGVLAVLGNHDTYLMEKPMVDMGINVLTNESVNIQRKGKSITITGTDDVHYYYSIMAAECLWKQTDGFKIALVHSPELYDVAAGNQYSLYLCGHTHGGQICLPNGKPLITHLSHGKEYFQGLWKYECMTGYTGSGTGTSGIPVRFNSFSEITLFTLKCK